jgi:hypothetical protein
MPSSLTQHNGIPRWRWTMATMTNWALADAFIEDATQWIDEDDDGFGDNQSGN